MATELLKKFLDDITLNDEKFKSYLQYIMGLLVNSDNKYEKLFVFYGEGSNGKSTLLALLEKLMGKSCLRVPEDFSKNLDLLQGVHCVIINDPDIDFCLNSSWIKKIMSRDQITTRSLNGEPYTYSLSLIPVIVTNQRPTKTNDSAFWERVELVHFRTHFVPESHFNPNNPSHRISNTHITDLVNNQEFVLVFSEWVRGDDIKEPE
jgi:putative DNA primase/helicase